MTNLHEILDKSRAAGQKLAPNEALVLFAAVVRLAASQNGTLRARLVQIDEAGGLHLFPFDEHAAEAEPGYEAPELLEAEPPRKTEPRVQVYAAGALGYELLTGRTPPPPGTAPGAELAGPVGDIVRMALAADRRERFADVGELQEAIEGLQPRPPAEGERNIFSALRTRWSRPPPEKEAVAKVIDRLHHVESQVVALSKAHKQIEATQRQLAEWVERFEIGQRRATETQRRKGASAVPGFVAGLAAALAVLAGSWALWTAGVFGRFAAGASATKSAPAPPPDPSSAAVPEPEPAAAQPAARPPPPARTAAAPDAAVAAQDATIAPQVADAAVGEASASGAAEDASVADSDAGAVAAADAGSPPATPPAAAAEKKAAEKKRKAATSPQAAMQHAVAVSQIRRGEAALEQGRADEALSSFQAALDSEPTIAAAFRGMGMALAMQGKNAEALQAYERYLKAAPSAPDAPDIRKSIRELKARAKSGG